MLYDINTFFLRYNTTHLLLFIHRLFFQNAWSGGYIAGTSIGKLSNDATLKNRGL